MLFRQRSYLCQYTALFVLRQLLFVPSLQDMVQCGMSLQHHPGQFIKKCPCSPQTVSCGYHNINLHTGCPFDCSYCILQLYLPSKKPIFFANREDAARELRHLSQHSTELRIGTGELADSLADRQCDELMPFLFELMAESKTTVLELKTKSSRIEALLKLPHRPNIVTAWSLSPQEIINREERKTAPLAERLLALSTMARHGYKVALHFDPVILTPDWFTLYQELIDEIIQLVPAKQIAWWSLGALRFPSGLRPFIFKHLDSKLFYGELVKGYDDKYRYLRPVREELFASLRAQIEKRLGTVAPLYLCMEDETMWRRVFPEFLPESESINSRLYSRVFT